MAWCCFWPPLPPSSCALARAAVAAGWAACGSNVGAAVPQNRHTLLPSPTSGIFSPVRNMTHKAAPNTARSSGLTFSGETPSASSRPCLQASCGGVSVDKENRGITMPWQMISSLNHPIVPPLRAVSTAFLVEPVSSMPEPTPCLWEFLFFGANKKNSGFHCSAILLMTKQLPLVFKKNTLGLNGWPCYNGPTNQASWER